jgi:hypothetical protein
MAISYADKRSRYRGVMPWDAAKVVSSTPATRGPAPRDNFRVVTADAPKPQDAEWTQQLDGTWAKKSPERTLPKSDTQAPETLAAMAGKAPNADNSELREVVSPTALP